MELRRWIFAGETREASFLREESAASRSRVWMKRIVTAVRADDARAASTRRVFEPFSREMRDSIVEWRECWRCRHGAKMLCDGC